MNIVFIFLSKYVWYWIKIHPTYGTFCHWMFQTLLQFSDIMGEYSLSEADSATKIPFVKKFNKLITSGEHSWFHSLINIYFRRYSWNYLHNWTTVVIISSCLFLSTCTLSNEISQCQIYTSALGVLVGLGMCCYHIFSRIPVSTAHVYLVLVLPRFRDRLKQNV